jgi:hypothetical protein
MSIKRMIIISVCVFLTQAIAAQWNPINEGTVFSNSNLRHLVFLNPENGALPVQMYLSGNNYSSGIQIGRDDGGQKILLNGRVGIGTNTPQVPLHSVGTFNMIQLRMERKGNYEGYCDLGGSNGDFRVWSGGYDQNHKFVVTGDRGYVGIGTLAPNYALEVNGHMMVRSNNYVHMGVERPDSDGKITMGVSSGGQEGFLCSKGELKFLTNAVTAPKMYIDKYGNVGIGTTKLNDRLEVNGTIRAKEVKVEHANWPDYVFSRDYALRDLGDVEAFIQEHQHLPGIPSQEEVEKKGVGLGEMDRKLLEKIEELTLYVIQQNKRIKELEVQNNELKDVKNELNKLKEIILQL